MLSVLLIPVAVIAAEPEGVKFVEGTYAEALEKAKVAKLLLFANYYTVP